MSDEALIRRIYDCALNPADWAAVMQDIAQHSGAIGAIIFDVVLDRTGQEQVCLQTCSSVYDPAEIEGYLARFNAEELRDQGIFARLSSQGEDVELLRCDRLTDSRAALEAQPNVQAMIASGVYYRAGALLCKDSLRMDRFALQSSRRQGPLTESALSWASVMLRHVAKAQSIGRAFRELHLRGAMLESVLGALPFGVAVVTGGRDILLRNPEFERLAEASGLAAPRDPTRLSPRALSRLPDIQRQLTGIEAHGTRGTRPRLEAGFMPLTEGAAQGLFVELSPLTRHPDLDRFGPSAYLMCALDSSRAHSIDLERLQRFFPLTASELAVLDLVARGHTNPEIADLRGRALETVNSQVKTIIRKTGSRNRTEMVRVAVGLSVGGVV
ncbi:helix-turn-helix transcriptional regulator [Roseinatronobacter monicus]|nr:helix-turn-helix transcriptional regulator [Roseinatronobacter monicus]